ncbi:MAG TPA: CBS domain-containing protein [Thermomicrobiales bacterium]|nr:CBS domain-containing protein [Thermomicrobiales bacterium]
MAAEQPSAPARSLFYLSSVLGKPIVDRQGERLGTVKDLLVRLGRDTHPPVAGLVAHTQGRDVFLPRAQVAELGAAGARLRSATIDLQRFARRDNEILLGRDVLDRQLIDVNGRRVIRVNDLQLARIDGEYRLVGVDVGGRALLRRLAPARFSRRALAGDLIDWAELEYFASHAPEVRLRVSHERIARLHPVEIARLVDALSYRQGAEVIESLDAETAAETLQEMTEERQADIVGGMDEERAADILEEMDPGDAADLLQDLSDEKVEDILERMEPDDQQDLRELLEYEEDTAGGIMTNDFVTVPADLTAAEAVDYIRALPEEPELLYYLYVVPAPDSYRLLGVVSLRDLLVRAGAATPLREVMATEIITARPDDAAREVARAIAAYNFIALPVVDDEGDIVGIVTVDDAMDLVLPEEWRPRVPKVFR